MADGRRGRVPADHDQDPCLGEQRQEVRLKKKKKKAPDLMIVTSERPRLSSLQARGRKFQERFRAASSASVAEGPAFAPPGVQEHHRRRPQEADHHGQPRGDAAEGPGEEAVREPNCAARKPRPSPAFPFQSPRRPLQRTFSDESLCSGRREASYAASDDQGAPGDVLFTSTLPTRRHAVSNQMQAKKSEFSRRPASASTQALGRSPPPSPPPQCPCPPLSCPSPRSGTKSPL